MREKTSEYNNNCYSNKCRFYCEYTQGTGSAIKTHSNTSGHGFVILHPVGNGTSSLNLNIQFIGANILILKNIFFRLKYNLSFPIKKNKKFSKEKCNIFQRNIKCSI